MWHKKQQPTFFTQQFDQLLSKDDKFRVIKEKIDFSFINKLARPYYGDVGPTGYPPDKLFRCLLVMFLEDIPSERKLEERLMFDIRYRSFCDLDIYDPIPDHATFSVLRNRLGDKLFYQIFEEIVRKASELGFVRGKHVSIDSTSVIADCVTPKKNQEKKPADEDASFGVKASGKKVYFGYKAHHLVDSKTDFIIDTQATPANVADIDIARHFVRKSISKGVTPKYLAADKAYSEHSFRHELRTTYKITPVIPLRKSGRKAGFDKDRFIFDEKSNLICPAGHHLKREGKNKNFTQYRGSMCPKCYLKKECTTGKYRTVCFSNFDPSNKEAAFAATDEFNHLYLLRNSTERVNANAKANHGLSRARYRGLPKVRFQVIMTAIAINLKKMANWLAEAPPKTALAHST